MRNGRSGCGFARLDNRASHLHQVEADASERQSQIEVVSWHARQTTSARVTRSLRWRCDVTDGATRWLGVGFGEMWWEVSGSWCDGVGARTFDVIIVKVTHLCDVIVSQADFWSEHCVVSSPANNNKSLKNVKTYKNRYISYFVYSLHFKIPVQWYPTGKTCFNWRFSWFKRQNFKKRYGFHKFLY